MRLSTLIAAAAALFATALAPAYASLVGATIQSAFYLGVSDPPPAASPTECTVIDCMILDYNGTSGPTNSPLPSVPVHYLLDALTETTVSVGDTQITTSNDFSGLFCPAAECTVGEFSGYVFTFAGAPDITNVMVDSASTPGFSPISGGLTFTATTISVNLNGDSPGAGDVLFLDVATAGSSAPTVPELSSRVDVRRFRGAGTRGMAAKSGTSDMTRIC